MTVGEFEFKSYWLRMIPNRQALNGALMPILMLKHECSPIIPVFEPEFDAAAFKAALYWTFLLALTVPIMLIIMPSIRFFTLHPLELARIE